MLCCVGLKAAARQSSPWLPRAAVPLPRLYAQPRMPSPNSSSACLLGLRGCVSSLGCSSWKQRLCALPPQGFVRASLTPKPWAPRETCWLTPYTIHSLHLLKLVTAPGWRDNPVLGGGRCGFWSHLWPWLCCVTSHSWGIKIICFICITICKMDS